VTSARPAWPASVLVVADLGGGGTGPARPAGGPLEALFEALAPRLSAGPGLHPEIRFGSLADFTPAGLRRAGGIGDLDAVLHAPPFQALEAAWRGLALALGAAPRGDGGGPALEVLDLPESVVRREPETVFRGLTGEPLRRRTAIALDLEVGASPADGALARALAALAERHRTPVILGAAPSLLGLRHTAHLPALPDPASRLDTAWGGGWREFRAADAARWVCLTINRFLLRPAYTDSAGGHAEKVSPARPQDFLWGRGAWLVAADLLRSAAACGDPLALGGITTERYHAGLPVWSWSGPGGETVASALEARLERDTAERLVRAGLTPVFEALGPGTAVLPLVVNAYRPDPRRIPVEGTLAHTLVLARLVAALAAAVPAVEAEPDDAAAGDLLAAALRRSLATRLTDAGGATLESAVERPGGRRVARAALRGDFTGSGRDGEIELSLPLGEGSA
jgi:hypothetical protein